MPFTFKHDAFIQCSTIRTTIIWTKLICNNYSYYRTNIRFYSIISDYLLKSIRFYIWKSEFFSVVCKFISVYFVNLSVFIFGLRYIVRFMTSYRSISVLLSYLYRYNFIYFSMCQFNGKKNEMRRMTLVVVRQKSIRWFIVTTSCANSKSNWKTSSEANSN